MNEIEITSLDLVEGANVVRQGHYITLGYVPRDQNGNAVDLTGKTVSVAIYSKKNIIFETAATFIGGVLRFILDTTIDSGNVQVEFTATSALDAKYRQKFPTNKNAGRLTVVRSTDDLDYFGVSTMTVEKFRKEFDVAVAAATKDAEVALARKEFTTLGERLDAEKQEVNQELAEKAAKSEVRFKNESIGLNDADSQLLAAIQGSGGTVFNLLSEPRISSVSHEKTTFIRTGKNLFNKAKATAGKDLHAGANGNPVDSSTASVSGFESVTGGTVYTPNTTVNVSFYDDNKAFISHAGVTAKTTFTTPANARYIRFGFTSTALNTLQIEKGSASTAYEPYIEKLEKVAVDEMNLSQGINEKLNLVPTYSQAETINVVEQKVRKPKNLVNPAKLTSGQTLASGNLTANASYTTLDFTRVEPGESYVGNRATVVAEYDLNMNYIKQTSKAADVPYVMDSETRFVRVAFATVYLATIQFEKATVSTTYESYFDPYLAISNESVLKGKKGASFGDSITQFGDYHANISANTGANISNVGFGATRLVRLDSANYPYAKISMCEIADAIASDDWTIMQPSINAIDVERGDTIYSQTYNRLKNLDFATLDFITIMYGTNDVNSASLTLGAIDSTDTYTINGAMNHVITAILTKYPHIKIYWMAPIFKQAMNNLTGNSDEVTAGVYLYDIAAAMKAQAKRYHIPFKDLYNESGINALTASYYLSDGIHPGTAGKKLLTEKIQGFLLSN